MPSCVVGLLRCLDVALLRQMKKKTCSHSGVELVCIVAFRGTCPDDVNNHCFD